jgi:ABC-type metal ion transport system, periplasmic component/surface adhesin
MNRLKKVIKWSVLLAMVAMFTACPLFADGTAPAKGIKVVAAENFYGDIVKQIGGKLVKVTSILADPNVDPHEYESNVNDAKAIAAADLVIENSGGYDDWMDKLLAASPNRKRIVLKGFDIATNKLPDNEHIWYSVDNIQIIARSIAGNLKKLDPANAAAFANNLQAFNKGLDQIRQKIAALQAKYQGTSIGLTETIFLYQTGPLGLKVLTPLEFQKAIAEGNDPPADTIITAEKQIKNKAIKALVYNVQTVSKITTKLQNDAKAAKIPIVAVSETMPADKNYQSWMLGQLNALEKALER